MTPRPARMASLALAALLAPALLAAADFSRDAIGTHGSDVLNLDVGPRGIALGGAYTALSDDSFSLYWNPAGLARVPRFSSSYQSSLYVADIMYHSASVAYRVKESIAVGAGLRFIDVGRIPGMDISGTPTGDFNPRHYILELGWGQNIYDQSDSDMDLSVGATGRWLHSVMVANADAWAADIGVHSRFFSGPIIYDLGASFQNFGFGQNFVSVRDSLPFRMRFGGALYPMRDFSLSADIVTPIYDYPYAAVGTEYTFRVDKNLSASVRAGFNSRTLRTLGAFSTASMGMGVKYADLSVDYAFNYMGVLGSQGAHRLAISFNLPSKSSKRYRER